MCRYKFMVPLIALLIGIFAPAVHAAFPEKPVTVICPWTAGGGTDILLRGLSREAEKFLGQTINVVNQTGGAGAIGHNAIRAARPDGYTLGMITFELNSLPPQGLVPFTWRDFDPIMRLNDDPGTLTVRKNAPYNTLREFVDYAKTHSGEIAFGNSGPGAGWHIAAGLLAEKTAISVKHVPFDGAQPAVTSLVGGHISAVSVSVAEVRSQVLAGNLKILGVMSSERDKQFPDIPTFAEQGVDIQFGTWRGLAMPKGVPPANRQKVIDAYRQAFETTAFREFAAKASLNLSYQDGVAFAKFLEQNYKEVDTVMRSLGLARKN